MPNAARAHLSSKHRRRATRRYLAEQLERADLGPREAEAALRALGAPRTRAPEAQEPAPEAPRSPLLLMALVLALGRMARPLDAQAVAHGLRSLGGLADGPEAPPRLATHVPVQAGVQ